MVAPIPRRSVFRLELALAFASRGVLCMGVLNFQIT
jgi:hypothetical protein